MKRQHPTDPNLFWCPRCKTYKAREEFSKNKNCSFGVASPCKKCRKRWEQRYKDSGKAAEWRQRYRDSGKAAESQQRRKDSGKFAEYQQRYRDSGKAAEAQQRYKKTQVAELREKYIKDRLRQKGAPITKETIELKRQQITMIRRLKQFKQWRKENESNYTDV